MRILFLSTLNLATNPRLYKEIMVAKKAGHEVEIVCFEFNNWSYDFNRELLQTLGETKVHLIKGNRKPYLKWAWCVFKERAYRLAGKVKKLKGKTLSQAVTRRSDLIIQAVDKLTGDYDLVIGHNPGALFPVYYASEKFACRSGFDVEDYHPGEGNDKHVQQLTKELMNDYLPLMDYVTFAAPMMKKKHEDDLGREGDDWHVILNLFPKNQFAFSESQEEPLQIVWFSQNVNYKRGLEQWIPALEQFTGEVELTLIGNKKEPFYSEYVEGKSFIKYIEPMSQTDLNRLICSFDVGLAIEQGKDLNNIIALSNKLITYFQAGLYILASETPGQQEFLKEYKHSGMVISVHDEKFMDRLAGIIASKDSIRRTKSERFRNAQQYNWEAESEKLMKVWGNGVGG